jgi:hypothetical protein
MDKKITTKIGKINNYELNDIAEIHYKYMRGTFSKLGIEFIKKFYESVNIAGKFYIKKKNKKVIAYGCWTNNTKYLNDIFIKKNKYYLISYVFKNLFSNRIIIFLKIIIFSILKSDKILPKAEYIAAAKIKNYKKPFIYDFIKVLENDFKIYNVLEYYVYVQYKLPIVIKLYLMNGFKIIKKVNFIYPSTFLIKKI